MEPAPIVLFVYNRPWHTLQTLEALERNELAEESVLYIYSDGPRGESQVANVNEVREVIRRKKWCGEVHLIEKETNYGLADSVIAGVTEVVNRHGKIIVLEDDLITSKYFLKYMNNGLEMYKDSPNVYSINGFQFPIKEAVFASFLCPLAVSSWGWATWADKWEAFEEHSLESEKKLIQNNKFLRARFNFGDYNYADMLDNSRSWAIRWYFTVFKRNGLGIFPTISLVHNIGFDGSGEHCDVQEISQLIYENKINITKQNTVDLQMLSKMLNYFEIKTRVEQDIKEVFKKIKIQLLDYIRKK